MNKGMIHIKKSTLFNILISTLLIFTGVNSLSAQKLETYDIITFKTPKGWQKEISQSSVQFGVEDSGGGVCLVTMFKSIPGTDDSRANFEAAWNNIVKEMATIRSAPEMQPATNENGWTAESGFARYESNGKNGIVVLVTITGNSRMVNIVILTNTDTYQQQIDAFLNSITFPKTVEPSKPIKTVVGNQIVGTWLKKSGSSISYADPVSAGTAGYSKDQYVFNADGTYHFYSKLFRYSLNKLLLVKESGVYQMSGNNLTLTPHKSVIESWSKANGTDKWGKLLATQNRRIEKTTYQFTKHYFSGIEQWNLVLQTATPTERDGLFSGNTTFPNAYYYAPISQSNVAIELP
jgi:hypothetical protein